MNANSSPDYDVIIIGAGPVGLLLAADMGLRGRRVLVAEKRMEELRQSMAIGITPPSLAILKKIGLDIPFVQRGVRIERVGVTENRRVLGYLDFLNIPAEHRFILSLPQSETVRLLRERVAALPSVLCLDGQEFTGFAQEGEQVQVRLRNLHSGVETSLSARFIVGCDGVRSTVRQAAGIQMKQKKYRARFVMADFDDRTDFGPEARLFFSADGSVESFPLPGGLRRWILLANRWNDRDPVEAYIVERVRVLTGFDLSGSSCRFESSFQPCWGLAERYGRGRMALCGDAAHQMSPIGGQGMNTGFADAALLAEVLEAGLSDIPDIEHRWALYSCARRKAFRMAAARAARGMWLGTRTGTLASCLRRIFITHILFHPSVKAKLAPYFAMLTLPSPVSAGLPLCASKRAS